MKKKIIVNGILAVVVLAMVVFVVASFSDSLSSQRRYVRPADYIVPKDQLEYGKVIGPAKLPAAANMAFLRSLAPSEFTDRKIRFEFDEKVAQEPVQSSEVGYSVEYLDLDNLDMTAGYVRPLAIGVAGPYVPEKGTLQPGKDREAESMPYEYYDLKGNPLAQDVFDAKEEVRTERWVGPGSLNLQIVFEAQNMESPRFISSFLFDSVTFARPTSGYTYYNRPGNPFDISYGLKVYHPANLKWVVDMAYGPCEYIDIPLKKGEEAVFADASFRLLTDSFRGSSGLTMTDASMVEYTLGISNNRSVAVGMSPKCLSNLFTAQFLDKDRQPLDVEKSVCTNSFIEILTYRSDVDGEYLRIGRYAGIKRFVMDIGKLLGTPQGNDSVNNLMDVKIPYVYVNNVQDVGRALDDVVQLNVSIPWNLSSPMPQKEYYDISALELLQEVQKLLPGDEINIDLERGNVSIGPPPDKVTMWQQFKDWLGRVF